MDTYIGSPYQMLHDLRYSALKTLTLEADMPHLNSCIDSIEYTHTQW